MESLAEFDDLAVAEVVAELDENDADLWRQLRRKRDFELRVDEKRLQLQDHLAKHQGGHVALKEAGVSVELLQKEVKFVKDQHRELEHDLMVLKESNRLLQQAFQVSSSSQAPLCQSLLRSKDFVAEERARVESLQVQQEQVEHLRMHIESLRVEKQSLQQSQQVLFHKQRNAEQDRNRLLGALQDDRNSLNDLRAERIQLLEQRTLLDKQMAAIASQVHGRALDGQPSNGFQGQRHSPSPEQAEAANVLYKLPGSSGGVRGHVPHDAPLPQSWFASNSSEQEMQRTHWTSFEKTDADGTQKKAESPSFGGRMADAFQV
ncbi:unnamed protein product [Symbiodinium pilosum]|uniref:Uncharacterized protein n=1 Tax=Symbiodinium pilosum TaxID=2952 RepID=A0A812X2R3_SYMPI|nr:unnamed protein product [Symbiodinium pilosum]